MLQTLKLRQTLCLQQFGPESSRQLALQLSRRHGWLPFQMMYHLVGYFKYRRSVTGGDIHEFYSHWCILEEILS